MRPRVRFWKCWVLGILVGLTGCQSHVAEPSSASSVPSNTLAASSSSLPSTTDVAAQPSDPALQSTALPATSTSSTPLTQASVATDDEFTRLFPESKNDGIITLAGNPRVHSTYTSVVPGRQVFEVYFRAGMERLSVEKAFLNNLTGTSKDPSLVIPTLTFHWSSSRKLEITAETPIPATPDTGSRHYLLTTKGARTADGQTIEADAFDAYLFTPVQLWRISPDGRMKEQVTSFNEIYRTIQPISDTELLLGRSITLCECNGRAYLTYSIYDMQNRSYTPTSYDLLDHYTGTGNFYIDDRGFFYQQPEDFRGEQKNMTPPDSSHAQHIQMDGYIHGATFSADRRKLILMVGPSQDKMNDLSLVVRDLTNGRLQSLASPMEGYRPNSPVGLQPIRFVDNGEDLYFQLAKTSSDEPELMDYRYHWQSGELLHNDIHPLSAADFSDDHRELVSGGSVHRIDNDRVQPVMKLQDPTSQQWLVGSHKLAIISSAQSEQGSRSYTLQMLDVDQGTTTALPVRFNAEARLVGQSQDGQWLYVTTSGEPMDQSLN